MKCFLIIFIIYLDQVQTFWLDFLGFSYFVPENLNPPRISRKCRAGSLLFNNFRKMFPLILPFNNSEKTNFEIPSLIIYKQINFDFFLILFIFLNFSWQFIFYNFYTVHSIFYLVKKYFISMGLMLRSPRDKHNIIFVDH